MKITSKAPSRDGRLPPAAMAVVLRVLLLGSQFAISVALARHLSPHEVGLAAMVGFVGAFAAIAGDGGLTWALARRTSVDAVELAAARGLSIAVGVAGCLLAWSAAPLLGWFYGEPDVVALVHVQALSFVAWGLAVVPRALLIRDGRFGRALGHELVATVVAGAWALVMARSGSGPLAIAAYTLGLSIVSMALDHVAAAPPAPRLSLGPIRSLVGESVPLAGQNSVAFWARQLDAILVGRLAGPWALGLYTRSVSLAQIPTTHAFEWLNGYLVPRLRPERGTAACRAAFADAQGTVGILLLPALVAALVASSDIVAVLLGARWDALVPVLRWALIAALLQVPVLLAPSVFVAAGRGDELLRWRLRSLPLTLAGVAAGAVLAGATGAVVGLIGAQVAASGLLLARLSRQLQVPMRTLLAPLAPGAWCAVAMGAVLLLTGAGATGHGSAARLLEFALVVGALSAGVFLLERRTGHVHRSLAWLAPPAR